MSNRSIQDELSKAQLALLKTKQMDYAASAEMKDAMTQKVELDAANQNIKTATEKQLVNGMLWDKFWKRIGGILSSIGSAFKVVFRDLSPYIALIFVILLLIWVSRKSRLPNMGSGGRMRPPKLTWFDKYFLPSYQIRSLTNMFAGDPPGADRPKEVNGRCDNIEWQDAGGSGSGLCAKTYKPDVVSWTFDTDKMPEINKLPAALSDRLNVTSRMQVFIPWEAQGTFYVPQCSKAYFKEMDSNGNEITTDASYLFEDKGLVCKRVEKASTKYGTAYRPKGTKDLYNYATEDDPKC